MASKLIVALAATGLVMAGVPAQAATRSVEALPVAKAALVQAAPAKAVGTSCFMPVKNGKIGSVADFKKAKAAGACTPALMQTGAETAATGFAASQGFAVGHTFMFVVAGVGVASAVAFTVCNDKQARTSC